MTGPCLCGDPACGRCFPGGRIEPDPNCPKCDSESVEYFDENELWKCSDCGHEFSTPEPEYDPDDDESDLDFDGSEDYDEPDYETPLRRRKL